MGDKTDMGDKSDMGDKTDMGDKSDMGDKTDMEDKSDMSDKTDMDDKTDKGTKTVVEVQYRPFTVGVQGKRFTLVDNALVYLLAQSSCRKLGTSGSLACPRNDVQQLFLTKEAEKGGYVLSYIIKLL